MYYKCTTTVHVLLVNNKIISCVNDHLLLFLNSHVYCVEWITRTIFQDIQNQSQINLKKENITSNIIVKNIKLFHLHV